MKNTFFIILVVLAVLVALPVLFGDILYDRLFNWYASKYASEIEFSKHFFDLLQARDFIALEKIEHIEGNQYSRANHDAFAKIAALFPVEKPSDVKLVGVGRNISFVSGDQPTTEVSFEYNFSGKWVYADAISQDNPIHVIKWRIMPLHDSFENVNKFTFIGKPFISFVVLASALIILIFIVACLNICRRTPVLKRKWLWILFIAFGIMSIKLNWTNANIDVVPLSFQFLGAGWWRASPLSPVVVSVSIPLGAIIFLIRHKMILDGRRGPTP